MTKFILIIITIFTTVGCSVFSSHETYLNQNSTQELTIYQNGNVESKSLLVKMIHGKGKVVSKSENILDIEMTIIKPKWEPETKVIRIELLPNNKYKTIKQ